MFVWRGKNPSTHFGIGFSSDNDSVEGDSNISVYLFHELTQTLVMQFKPYLKSTGGNGSVQVTSSSTQQLTLSSPPGKSSLATVSICHSNEVVCFGMSIPRHTGTAGMWISKCSFYPYLARVVATPVRTIAGVRIYLEHNWANSTWLSALK